MLTGAYIITAISNGQSVTGTVTVTSSDGNGNGNGNGNSNGNGNGNGGGNNGGNNGGGNNQGSDTSQRTDAESETDRRYAFQLNLYAGWNLVHIPLEVTQVNGQSMSIETLGNLFQVLMPAHMYIHDGSCWIGDIWRFRGTAWTQPRCSCLHERTANREPDWLTSAGSLLHRKRA